MLEKKDLDKETPIKKDDFLSAKQIKEKYKESNLSLDIIGALIIKHFKKNTLIVSSSSRRHEKVPAIIRSCNSHSKKDYACFRVRPEFIETLVNEVKKLMNSENDNSQQFDTSKHTER